MCTLFWRKSPFDDVHASHSIRFRSTIKKIRIEKNLLQDNRSGLFSYCVGNFTFESINYC